MRRELGWIEKRFGTGGAATRRLYAGARRLRNRGDLARRRALALGLVRDPDLTIRRSRGFLTLPPDRLPAADAVARIARRLADEARAVDAASQKKMQLTTGLLSASELTLDSPLLELALDPDLVGCVSDYLGAVPLLASLDVWMSAPTPEAANSQLFHCDWADLAQVKVFVYATEVDRDSGPLVVLGADTSERLREQVRYRWRGKRYRIRDEEVAARVGNDDCHEILGSPGTVALVDTCRCFHYGSRFRAADASRAICMLQYLLPSAFSVPRDPRERGPLQHLATPQMSEVERLVLGAE